MTQNRIAAYEETMRRRKRRRAARTAASDAFHVEHCPNNPANRPASGLFAYTLRRDQLSDFTACCEALGGEWLAYIYHRRPDWAILITTVDVCGGPPCDSDHRRGGLRKLVDLIFPPTMTPPPVWAWRSHGWVMPGFHYEPGN